ncbi:MAG: choice-of-anchor B family protein [Bacteroidetes bacterium]|nr:MAG: choice-of-anchor B family protein [Bacteroidota bacterium]
MYRIILFVCLLLAGVSKGQLNFTQIGHIDLNTLHDQGLNDVWGYEDETGIEYVLAGGTKGTSVVSLQDPSNPVEVFFEPGMESIWRDLKTYNDHAYITTEALNGLLIIDLTPLPSSTVLPVSYYTGPFGFEWQSAHNLYIDESGYAYIFGANRGNGGVIILNLNPDPMNPVEVGVFDNWYVHDGYAVNDTLYCGHIEEGFMSIVDVTDRSAPQLLGTVNTPSLFTHNVWTMGNVAFTTDEVSGGYIGVYDISDPSAIVELDRVQSSPGTGVIPHNTHVLGNYVITSYYSDGVVVHDASYPYNLVEVANFDTYPGQTTSYDGCWGVYPFFNSGLMAATDRTEGLFILDPNLSKAAYLEGTVSESGSGVPLNNVEVKIVGSDHLEHTSAAGFYATGMATGGSYQVICSKVGYYPDTATVALMNDVVTVHDVVLVPIPPFNLTVRVRESGTLNPILDAEVELKANLITHNGLTNGLGEETFSLFYEEDYSVRIGKWGYVTYCDLVLLDATTGVLDVLLTDGYYDDFTFDFGWTTTSTAVTGAFVREDPNGTTGFSQTEDDVSSDCDERCYVTGNNTQAHPDVDDVDDGVVRLMSPIMDLTSYTDPYLNFDKWFFCLYGPFAPDDSLKVFIDNGLSGPVLVDVTPPDETLFYQWHSVSLRISDFVSPTANMQVTFETSDLPGAVNITEAAIDHFYIAEAAELGLSDKVIETLLYPNPANNDLTIEGIVDSFEILDMFGKVVYTSEGGNNTEVVSVLNWTPGLYILKSKDVHHKFIVEK